MTALLAAILWSGCTADPTTDAPRPPPSESGSTTAPSPTATARPSPSDSAPSSQTSPSEPTPDPISVAALATADLPGTRLQRGAILEQNARYTSYAVTFFSTTAGRGTRPLKISGVLNVPTGPGPFPAVVLAHGYIEPAIYARGQGMTRERGYLADRGYVALHVDYRNHAESTVDPRVDSAVRLGYSIDVIAAVRALRSADGVPVDPDRVAFFGRSMGTGVVLKALEAEPGLVQAAVAWASVSSLEAQNYRRFIAPDASRAQLRAEMAQRHGLPDEDPEFWRGISSRPGFDQITEPVLLVHGRLDSTCPPRWARATQTALQRAGVDSTLEWYDDQHAFGPAFVPAMDRTVEFLERRMPESA